MTYPIKKPIILGAGPAGLCVGWNLSLDGVPITILEKNNSVGGLALTFKDGGYSFDLGPHNIHTVYPDIMTFLQKILGKELRKHNPDIKIFFRGRFVTYPLKGIHVFSVLPIIIIIPAGLSFLWARIKILFRKPKNDTSFESWIKNRFGRFLYNYYFGPYAKKVWKINASEISHYVAEKRIPVLTLTDYMRRIAKIRPRNLHGEDWAHINHYYPKKGVGQITDYLAKGIIDSNNKIKSNVKVLSINGEGRRVESVTFKQDGEVKKMETDFLFSTIPINDLIGMLKLDVPTEVKKAASNLDYCSEVLLYIKISKPKVFATPLTYFSDSKIKFNRVYEVGSFSKECVPPGKTALCIEYTCNNGDDIWNSTPEELFNNAISVFKQHQMLSDEDVEGYLVKRITHAYPRFRVGFEKKLKTILDYLSTIENMITLGRQGLFCYANVDDVLRMGFRATEMVNTIQKKRINYSELFPESSK